MTLMLVEHHYVHQNRVTEEYLKVLGYKHHVRRGIRGGALPAVLRMLACGAGAIPRRALGTSPRRAMARALEMISRIMLEGYQGHHPV